MLRKIAQSLALLSLFGALTGAALAGSADMYGPYSWTVNTTASTWIYSEWMADPGTSAAIVVVGPTGTVINDTTNGAPVSVYRLPSGTYYVNHYLYSYPGPNLMMETHMGW